MAVYKNKASQKLAVFAVTTSTGAAKTGDAANITAYISKDGGAATATNDTNPTELDATNAAGIYLFDLTQAETNADLIVVTPKSATSGVTLRPVVVYTEPEERVAASVTGAVGSVTGAVGSVTGNVGGNVVGSVASVTGNVGGNVVGSVASVTGAVGSVTGNVGGNVVGSVASVTADVTVGTNNDKTGYELSGSGVSAIQSGLALEATLTAMKGAGWTNEGLKQIYDEVLLRLATSGYTAPDNAGVAAIKAVTDQFSFTGSDVKATLDGETVVVGTNNDKSDYTLADGSLTAAKLAADAITAAKVAADAVTEIQSGLAKTSELQTAAAAALTAYDPPTKAEMDSAVAGVWDATLASHLTAGSTGEALNAAGSAGDPWTTALPGAYGAGTAGNILGSRLDAAVTSRLASGPVTVGTNNDKTGYSLTAGQITSIQSGLALEATLTAMKGAGWTTQTLKAIYDALALKLDASAYTAPNNAAIAAIQAVTDLFRFTGNDVKATLDGETVVVSTNNDKTGYALSGAAITAVQSGLALEATLTAMKGVGWTTETLKAIYDELVNKLDTASYTAPDNAGIAAVQAVTDKLDTTLEDSAGYRFTDHALEQAPAGGGGGGSTAAQIWAYATRTLTQSGAAIQSAITGSTISIKRGDTNSITLTVGSLTNMTDLWFTVKESLEDDDSAAILQVSYTGGLLIVNGAAPTSSANGSITPNSPDMTILLKPAETANLVAARNLYWDVQIKRSTSIQIQTLAEGLCHIVGDVTRRI